MKGNHESQYDNRTLKDSGWEFIHRKKRDAPALGRLLWVERIDLLTKQVVFLQVLVRPLAFLSLLLQKHFSGDLLHRLCS